MLVGGGSNFKGLLGYLKSKLSWDVSVGDPWINLNLDKKLPAINQANSVRFAVCIGLAMRKADYGNKT
jgi:Tfp pilus assembly PilM family ATPase